MRRRLLAALFLFVGVVLLPLHAVAATIPTIIAYEVAVRSTATTTLGKRDAVRPEVESARTGCDDATFAYDDSSNRPTAAGIRGILPYDDASNFGERHELGESVIYGASDATSAAEAVGGIAAKYTASTPQSAIALAKQLASEAQLGEMAAGAGRPIAGAGADAVFRDAARIAQTYGGNAADWAKMSSSGFRAADGTTFAKGDRRSNESETAADIRS